MLFFLFKDFSQLDRLLVGSKGAIGIKRHVSISNNFDVDSTSGIVPVPSSSAHKYNYERSTALPFAKPLLHRTVKPHNYSLVVKSAAYAAVTASRRLSVPCIVTTCY